MRGLPDRNPIPRRTFLSLVGTTVAASTTLSTSATANDDSTVGTIASLPANDWSLLQATDLFSDSEHRTGTEQIFKDHSLADENIFTLSWEHSYFTETVITQESQTESNSRDSKEGQNSQNNEDSTAGSTGFHSSAEDTLTSRFPEFLSEQLDNDVLDNGSGLSIAFDSNGWFEFGEWELQDITSNTLAEYSTFYWVGTPDSETDDPDSLIAGLLVSIPVDDTTHYGLGIVYPVELGFSFGTGYRPTTDLVPTLETSTPTS